MDKKEPFRKIAPDQLELIDGGGCMALIGVPFLGSGVFVLLVGLGLAADPSIQDSPVWVRPLLVLFGLMFAGVGCGLVFGRTGILIDKTRQKLYRQYRLFVPVRTKVYDLFNYDAVLIRFNSGDSDSSDSFPVLLKGKGGTEDLTLFSPNDFGQARSGSAGVAQLLRLPLVDASTDHKTVIDPACIGGSLAERLAAGAGADERVDPPPGMKSTVQKTGGTLQIDIPGPGLKTSQLASLIVPVTILLVGLPFVREFIRQTEVPGNFKHYIMGNFIFVFAVIPLLGLLKNILVGLHSRTRVTVSAGGIVIKAWGALRSREKHIPADEILGLDYGTLDSRLKRTAESMAAWRAKKNKPADKAQPAVPGWLEKIVKWSKSAGVTVKTGGGLVYFGAGLADAEVHYLYLVVRQALHAEKHA